MSIFRAYDIRGIYGKDITTETAEKIGKAFATYVNGGEIVVGYDARIGSPELRDSLISGLISSGCNVIDIGMVPTPLVYFTISHFKKDGGIVVTGSHNPPEYNGFKLCKGTHTLYGSEIQELKNIIDSNRFRKGNGDVRSMDVKDIYIDFIRSKINLKKKLKIVVDGGNGAADGIAENLFRKLGCDISCIYCEPNGEFPNHFPDPTVDSYLKDLIENVKKENADIGIAYDGDCDRLGVVDDRGNIVRGDQILILFSRQVLQRMKNAKIIFEVKCSQALIEEIKKNGGVPIMYKTGHSFIKKKMRDEKSPLAGEMSGHFFFADNYYGYDDGIFASARIVEILSNSGKKLSELIDEMPHYYSTPEIRIKCDDEEKFMIVENIREIFKDRYDIIDIDGARIQFDNGWGLIRASNTEPAIILRFESVSKKGLKNIKEIVMSELKNFLHIPYHLKSN
ncbi:MAG: phosphomannomutase [Candidatus Altiarchaeales archaeon]|nr:MAG: phosphomannomutase [Candidatus Altiarchaeales archaeon]